MGRARPFGLIAGLLGLAFALIVPLRSAAAPLPSVATASFWFAGTRLDFERPRLRAGALAVGTGDGGLARFLAKLGATLGSTPGGTTIVVTGGDRRVVRFTLGDSHVTVDGVAQPAAFAPYLAAGVAYLPFLDLARALSVVAVNDGVETVLEPELSALNVRAQGRVTIVTFRGAAPLRFRRLSDDHDEQLSLALPGIASSLDPERTIGAGAVRGLAIVASGYAKNPTTVVNFETVPGSTHALVPSDSPNTIAIAFAPPGVVLGGTPIPADGLASIASLPLEVRDVRASVPAPVPPISPKASAVALAVLPRGAATPTAVALPTANVTGYATTDVNDGMDVHLDIAGNVTYEWHRLPDNRWYVDLKPATLVFASQDIPLPNAAVQSLRIKAFVGPNDNLPTVRVALTLASPRIVALVPDGSGLTLAVDRRDDPGPTRTASGELAGGQLLAAVPLPPPVALAPPIPPATDDGSGPDPAWKFAPPMPAASNDKLIVIDPGHGGSDSGAVHNGLTEAALNLDVSKRLRSLLIARGWQVKLTREGDTDVFEPNDSAHDELQARDDIANKAGARLFVSVHTNAFTDSSLSGTTTYYVNPDSYAFAAAIHTRLAAALPTKDDGIRKENFYVIHHAKMPAVLIEMAFNSNPGDAALLKSDAFLQNVAVSIADGVRDFATSQATSVSSSHEAREDGQ